MCHQDQMNLHEIGQISIAETVTGSPDFQEKCTKIRWLNETVGCYSAIRRSDHHCRFDGCTTVAKLGKSYGSKSDMDWPRGVISNHLQWCTIQNRVMCISGVWVLRKPIQYQGDWLFFGNALQSCCAIAAKNSERFICSVAQMGPKNAEACMLYSFGHSRQSSHPFTRGTTGTQFLPPRYNSWSPIDDFK